MENQKGPEESSLAVQNNKVWVEMEDGSFVSTQNYTDRIVLQDEEEFSRIDYKKDSIVQVGKLKQKTFKPGDVYYNPLFLCYVKLEKPVQSEEAAKISQWTAKLLPKKGEKQTDEIQCVVETTDLSSFINLRVKL